MTTLSLTGTIDVPGSTDHLTLEIKLDTVTFYSRVTISIPDDGEGRIVASIDDEAAWLITGIAEAVADLTGSYRKTA